MANEPSPAMRRAVDRAAEQPFFLAGVLRAYKTAHYLDDPELAELLGCAIADLPRLALCRRPQAPAAAFRADIEHLAARFGLRGDQLARLIREVDALEAIAQQTALQQQPAQTKRPQRLLRAARDRDEADDEAEPPTEDT